MFHYQKEREHIEYEGTRCPHCASREIIHTNITQRHRNRLYYGMTCSVCLQEWWDIFSLKGVDNVLPMKKTEKVA